MHMAIKGMKGQDYTKMREWYGLIFNNCEHLVSLIEQEKEHNAVKLTLTII